MLFLLQYDRRLGTLVSLQPFDGAARDEAVEARLALELELTTDGEGQEVVLLEAEDEDAMRMTHRRFFEDLSQLMDTPSSVSFGHPG